MVHITTFVLWLLMFLLFTKLSKVNDVNFCLLLDQSCIYILVKDINQNYSN